MNSPDLLEELLRLRKGAGLTAERLAREPLVATLLRHKADDSFERLRSRFVSAVHSLDVDDAALLLDVYRLSDETRNRAALPDRRGVYGNRIGRTPYTVARREEAAIVQLMGRLLRGDYRQSPLTVDVPDMHNGLICETVTADFVVENRLWKRTSETWRFVATFDEADHLDIVRSYPAVVRTDPRGAFRVRSEPIDSRGSEIITEDRFWHFGDRPEPKPMTRGNRYRLAFDLHPDDDPSHARPLRLATRAYHHRSLLTALRVTFVGEVPESVWEIREASHFALGRSPGPPAGSPAAGVYELTMRDTHGGLHSGFGWSWSDA